MSRFLMMIFSLKRSADKYSGEIGEDESLQKRYQYFNKINKHRKPDGYRCGAPSGKCIHLPEYKNQRNQTDDNNVTRNHIRKQTNNQGERLNKYTQKFYQYQNRFHETWHSGRIEYMSPEMFIGTK